MNRISLNLQPLDERVNPVVWNTPWADPGNITLSFAPDGTNIDGAPSALNQEFAGLPTATWQKEILRAVQAWAAQAGMNVGVVSDDGGAFGTAGPLQGDTRRGDIRIGARPLGPDQLAITTPFDLFGGWSGEIVLNTDKAFNLGGTGGAYDIFTVFVQEAGHAFGLPNSPNTSSVMYTTYQGPKAGLSAADVTAIQGLYGPRIADALEGAGNGTTLTAKPLTLISNLTALLGLDGTLGATPFVAAGDLTTASDVDVYKVIVPLLTPSFTVSLKTSGLSLLAAKMTVLNAAGAVVGTATATDPARGDLTVNLPGSLLGTTYYVKVEKGSDPAFTVGRYRLAIGAGAETAVSDPIISGLVKADKHTDDDKTKAVKLGDQKDGMDARWDFTTRAALSDTTDVDWYSVKAKAIAPGNLVVAVWGTQAGGVDPVVEVYDKNGVRVPADVLTNDGGAFTLQVRNAVASMDYFIRVAGDPTTGPKTGTYVLGADFRSTTISPQRLSAATLTAAAPQAAATMTVYQAQLFHFALATTTANPAVASAVRLSVRDSTGKEVYTLFANAGDRVSGDTILGPGTYTLVFTAGTQDAGVSLPDLSYTLDGLVRSDPIGLTATDTSGTSPPPKTSTTTTYGGTYTSPYRAV